MDFKDNLPIKLATEFIQFTNKNIFLTGKAGTGKTTFLRNIKNITHKRMVVVAPTGVAAINAGGVTIHSFFQLAFSPFIPETPETLLSANNFNNADNSRSYKLRKNKIKIIKSLDLLVIDEISMVRADLLDAVDAVLKRYRNSEKAFGGVQLLMIGDLHQLAPVVKEEEWQILKDYYKTVFFFSSRALQSTNFESIELKKIYRQEDNSFIKILGEIRNNKLTEDSVNKLNKRFIKDFNPDEKDGYINLTTHNTLAQDINNKKHSELKSKLHKFRAVVSGDFPEYMYPTLENLELKVGAQVMFIKNDSSFDKLYYNGKIGKITKIDNETIYVRCSDEHFDIEVKPDVWENIKYEFNDETKSITETKVGSFEQYPLKLAWAITIHKSQGLTFEKAVIDVNSAFASGQVYVALSRCRSLSGMVLKTPFSASNIKTDSSIKSFYSDVDKNMPDITKLEKSKKEFQQDLVLEAFRFNDLQKQFFYIKKLVKNNIEKFDIQLLEDLELVQSKIKTEIIDIGEKFKNQLLHLFYKCELPESDEQVQERIVKASTYFKEKIDAIFGKELNAFFPETDNKEINKSFDDAFERFELLIYIKQAVMELCKTRFNTSDYIKTIADKELDFKPKYYMSKYKSGSYILPSSSQDLYSLLNSWRKMVAEDENIPTYMIMPLKSLKELVEKMPSNPKELKKIKGFGKIKILQYGDDILDIINTYCIDNDIDRGGFDFVEEEPVKNKKKSNPDSKPKVAKTPSYKISYEMFNNGVDIESIAKERGFVESTIFSHLTKCVSEGILEPERIISLDKLTEIYELIDMSENKTLNELYEMSKGAFSYNELRIALSSKQ